MCIGYVKLSRKKTDFEKTKPAPRRCRDSNTIFTPDFNLNLKKGIPSENLFQTWTQRSGAMCVN